MVKGMKEAEIALQFVNLHELSRLDLASRFCYGETSTGPIWTAK